jgi:peptidoglycan DL-endopeptidase CwlO
VGPAGRCPLRQLALPEDGTGSPSAGPGPAGRVVGMRSSPPATRRFAGRPALAGSLLAALLAVGGAAPATAWAPAVPARPATAAPVRAATAHQAADGLRAKAEQALTRWDAHEATIEVAAEQVNAVAGQVGGLQARIAALDERRRAAGNELVGADRGSAQDPVAGLRGMAARFFNSFATGLSGALGGDADRRDYGPVLYELPQSIRERQRQTFQLEAQTRTLYALRQRLKDDQRTTPADVVTLARQLRKRREAERQADYRQWADGVRDQYGALRSGPLQPAQAAMAALTFALAQRNRPYLWGATGPSSYDCSGLTSTAYRQAGVAIPRVSRDQAGFGEPVAFNNLAAGDLVFFGNPVHHVGMYFRDGMMVHAPRTGDVVRVASIWRSGYAGARRPVAAIGGTGTGGPLVPPLPPPAEVVTPERRAPGMGTGPGAGGPGTSGTTGTTATTGTTTSTFPPTTGSGSTVVTDTTSETTTTEPPVSQPPSSEPPATEPAGSPQTSGGASEQPGGTPDPTTQPSASARAPP